MKLNKQIFHDFFYSARRNQCGKSNTHFSGNTFYSYNTVIGQIYDGAFSPRLFLSENNFSPTTAAHIAALREAAPFPVIFVPLSYYDYGFPGVDTLKKRFLENLTRLTYFKDGHFRREAERREFLSKLDNFRKFLGVTTQSCTPEQEAIIHGLETVAREIEETRRKAREKREAREAERREKLAEEFRKRLKNVHSLLDLIKAAFLEKNEEARKMLYMQYPGYSFVFPAANEKDVETSQGVKMQVPEVKTLYKLFRAGRLKEGMHAGPYTIREIAENYVQIGCHKLLMKNISELMEALA